jgi:hypothetical protein
MPTTELALIYTTLDIRNDKSEQESADFAVSFVLG